MQTIKSTTNKSFIWCSTFWFSFVSGRSTDASTIVNSTTQIWQTHWRWARCGNYFLWFLAVEWLHPRWMSHFGWYFFSRFFPSFHNSHTKHDLVNLVLCLCLSNWSANALPPSSSCNRILFSAGKFGRERECFFFRCAIIQWHLDKASMRPLMKNKKNTNKPTQVHIRQQFNVKMPL